jgi:hypothetical protein
MISKRGQWKGKVPPILNENQLVSSKRNKSLGLLCNILAARRLYPSANRKKRIPTICLKSLKVFKISLMLERKRSESWAKRLNKKLMKWAQFQLLKWPADSLAPSYSSIQSAHPIRLSLLTRLRQVRSLVQPINLNLLFMGISSRKTYLMMSKRTKKPQSRGYWVMEVVFRKNKSMILPEVMPNWSEMLPRPAKRSYHRHPSSARNQQPFLAVWAQLIKLTLSQLRTSCVIWLVVVVDCFCPMELLSTQLL